MRKLTHALTIAAFTAAVAAAPAAFAGDDQYPNILVKMAEKSKDGMVSKAEVMKTVEKMFDKHDTKKMGRLDKKQVEDLLDELAKAGG